MPGIRCHCRLNVTCSTFTGGWLAIDDFHEGFESISSSSIFPSTKMSEATKVSFWVSIVRHDRRVHSVAVSRCWLLVAFCKILRLCCLTTVNIFPELPATRTNSVHHEFQRQNLTYHFDVREYVCEAWKKSLFRRIIGTERFYEKFYRQEPSNFPGDEFLR